MTRPVRLAPDPVLRAVAAPVTAFDEGLRALAAEMLEAMYAAPGRGLAAPQLGEPLRVVVMDAGWKDGRPEPRTLVNPVVVEASEETSALEEACLSIPGVVAEVSRPSRVRVRWQGLDGAEEEGAFDGFAAACVQHEVDHLDGVLITDRAPGRTAP